MKTIAVVGGGITGLCTMHYLQKQIQQNNLQAKLVLIEKNDYLGGKIYSVHDSGYIMETGADSMVARYTGVLDLVKELNLESELVYNETGISYIYTNNELHAIPADSTFGIPMSVESLQASTLVSDQGKQEALKDLTLPNTSFTKESSIGEFLEYFLGKELVEKQIAPVLAGVYSGDLYQLSIASTLPYLVDYKNDYGSIIKGFDANRENFSKQANKKFVSFRNGLSAIIDRLEETLVDVTFKKGLATNSVKKSASGYTVSFENGEQLQADILVLALPNDAVKYLLADEALNSYFDEFKTASALTMYVGFDVPDEALPADGTGFIKSFHADVKCDASTWTSRKWKHTSAKGNLLVRMFYKSSNPAYEQLVKLSDEELANVAREDIRLSIGIEADPTVVKVTRWIDQMPKYDLQHYEALKGLTAVLDDKYPNLYIAGCSYFGVGIGACIQNGKQTGEKIASLIQ